MRPPCKQNSIQLDDAGHVKGLHLEFKRKDAWERRVHQLARTRIKPVPAVQIVFERVAVTAFVTEGSSFDAKPPLVCLRDGVKQRWVCRTWEEQVARSYSHFELLRGS